ncbi:hypothetical protein C8R45DRAFT_1183886 [Mycena sanguinolenta]|nr:hypothetical protein C8R45DRAFT_1183886 [Mycena sanguinolenta]
MSPPSTPPSIINTPPPPTARFTTPMHTVLRPSSFLLLSWPPRLFIYPQPAASTSVPPPTSRPEKQQQARQRSHDGDVTPRPWLGRASLRIHSHFTFATLFLPALPVICSRTHRRGLRRRKESPRGGVEATGCAIASRTRGSVHENVKGVVDVDTTVAHSCPSLKGDERKEQGNEERRKGSGKWKSEGKRERGRGSGKREVEGGRSSEQREGWRAGRRKDTYQGIPAHAHAHRSPNSTSTTHSPSTRSKACRQDGARRMWEEEGRQKNDAGHPIAAVVIVARCATVDMLGERDSDSARQRGFSKCLLGGTAAGCLAFLDSEMPLPLSEWVVGRWDAETENISRPSGDQRRADISDPRIRLAEGCLRNLDLGVSTRRHRHRGGRGAEGRTRKERGRREGGRREGGRGNEQGRMRRERRGRGRREQKEEKRPTSHRRIQHGPFPEFELRPLDRLVPLVTRPALRPAHPLPSSSSSPRLQVWMAKYRWRLQFTFIKTKEVATYRRLFPSHTPPLSVSARSHYVYVAAMSSTTVQGVSTGKCRDTG